MNCNVQEYESTNDSMITVTSRSVQSRLLRKAVAVSFWAKRRISAQAISTPYEILRRVPLLRMTYSETFSAAC